MVKPSRNDGKELERITQEALKQHHLKHKSNFYRLYDQTSTGGRGFASPGDFWWTVPGFAFLIECKSTTVCTPLLRLIRSSATSMKQVPRHKLHHISGHPSVYLYADLLNNEVIAYDGVSVVDAINNKHKKLTTISKSTMSEVGGLLNDIINYIRICT